jgi:hypothetical protein
MLQNLLFVKYEKPAAPPKPPAVGFVVAVLFGRKASRLRPCKLIDKSGDLKDGPRLN